MKQHFYRGKWKSQMTAVYRNERGKEKGTIIFQAGFGYLHMYYIL